MTTTPDTTSAQPRYRIKTDRGYCYGEEGGAYLFHRKPPRQTMTLPDAEYLARSLGPLGIGAEIEKVLS